MAIYNNKGSIGSLLMVRAAVKFCWVINSASESSSPTDSEFVQKFFKGLNRERQKMDILSNELVRRLSNVGEKTR